MIRLPASLPSDASDVVLGLVTAVAEMAVDPRSVVVVVVRRPQNRVPVGPAGSDPEGGRRTAVAVQELADVHGPVARPPEPTGEHVALVDQRRVGVGVRGHSVVVGVLPGEQRCARGAALRGRGDVVGELGAMPQEQPLRARHHPARELAHGLIVGLDQDDVRPAERGARAPAGSPIEGSDAASPSPTAASSVKPPRAIRPRERSGAEEVRRRITRKTAVR